MSGRCDRGLAPVAALGEALAAPRFAFGIVPREGDAAVLIEEGRPPGQAAELRSAGRRLVAADAAVFRTLGAVPR